LALFGIKHFIADFVMQYDYMISDKGIYGAPGGLHHAATHACLTFFILVIFYSNPNGILALSILDFVLHYHIDYIKQQLNQGLSAHDRMFWVWLGADQALHYLTYILIIAIVLL
jgi:hypothetical protein